MTTAPSTRGPIDVGWNQWGNSVPQLPVSLPFAPAPVGKLLGELDRLNRQIREANAERTTLTEGAQAAGKADLDALAEALREGRPDPGPANAVANSAALSEVERRTEALEVAARSVHSELKSAVNAHRDDWTNALKREIDGKDSKIEDAIAAISGVLAERAALQDALTFAADMRWKSRPAHVAGIVAGRYFSELRKQLLGAA
jgi:hypothetical protein